MKFYREFKEPLVYTSCELFIVKKLRFLAHFTISFTLKIYRKSPFLQQISINVEHMMKQIKTFILLGFITSIALNMVACSDNNNEQESKKESSGDHVWKTQTDALKSAKEMAKKMQESLDQQQEKMNDNN